MKTNTTTRRIILQHAGAMGLLAATGRLAPSFAKASAADRLVPPSSRVAESIALEISELPLRINGRNGKAIGINGSVPGPLIRLREGEEAVLRVTNRLKEATSIHWHGILVPPDMDGVPGVSFAGIQPGETFEYRFPVVQSGTYWCHSSSWPPEWL